MTVEVITLGCRLNAYESEVIRAKAREAGLENAIIVNTCAVTAEAVRQARQNIRRARKDNPGAKVIVTGCAAQTEPETFADMPEVDQVLGNADKLDARSYAFDAGTERVVVNDIMSVRETASHLIAGFDGRARAFVQVQNGCDHRCTFCIIPYGRGPSRSVPAGEVVAQVRGLVAQGIREVVLTGVDITAYGADLPGTPKLGRLVEQILTLVPELSRLRLSSLDVAECDERLIDLAATHERLMPHFVFPPLMIPDIWTDRRLDFVNTLEERLLAAACLHSRCPHIAVLSPLPPGAGWRRLAKRYQRKFVHVPLSQFGESTVQQLRMVHVLNGKQVRSYAAHFIRKA